MRGASALLCVLLVVVPSASAQNDLWLADQIGDVAIRSLGPAVPVPAPAGDHLDLIGAWLSNETSELVEVGARLRSWEPMGGATAANHRSLNFRFQIGGGNYSVWVPSQSPRCKATEADLFLYKGGYVGSASHACLRTEAIAAKAEIHVFLPRALLVDERYTPLQAGGHLANLRVRTSTPGNASDGIPDVGLAPPFVSRLDGDNQSGDLFLTAAHPIRASNGASTSLLFRLALSNAGNTEHKVAVTTEKQTDEWTLRTPATLRLPSKSTLEFPVIVAMNFSHHHGATETLRVRVESTADSGHFAERTIGVRWLEIPQPAGHHDKLWLHGRPLDGDAYGVSYSAMGLKSAWMNTLETDPAYPDAQADVPPSGQAAVAPGAFQSKWAFPLSPSLEMGIHVDPTRTGLWHGKVRTVIPSSTADMNVTLLLCDRSLSIPGRLGVPECPQASAVELMWGKQNLAPLPANGEKAFDVTLTANATASIVPFIAGNNLVLRATLITDTPQDTIYGRGNPPGISLSTRDSMVQLPLHEYHDPIDQAFQNLGTLSLRPLDAYEKQLNPGRSAVFRFDVSNTGRESQRLHVSVEGTNDAWVTVREPAVTLEPNQKTMVMVMVEAPPEAQAGENADLFVIVENSEDAAVATMARIRATVVDVSVADITDEAAIAGYPPDPGGAPGAGVLAAILAIASWTAVRRLRGRRLE